ncbi:hypothetical protein AML69_01555 [Escherichia coli]|nr:hypothetical protein AML69_01555 [Escherichia coli]
MNERLKTHSKTQKKSADLVSNKLRIGVFQQYQMKCKSVSKKSPRYINGVKQRHDWFVERLNTINHRYGLFSEVRGLGLLIGCVLNADYAGQAKQISQEAAKAGVMVLIAGGNVVRFAPALNVSEEEVTTGLDRFAAACEHFVSRGSS